MRFENITFSKINNLFLAGKIRKRFPFSNTIDKFHLVKHFMHKIDLLIPQFLFTLVSCSSSKIGILASLQGISNCKKLSKNVLL